MIIKQRILLLKSQLDEENNKYSKLLQSHGFRVLQVKTLEFSFKNLDSLIRKLNTSDSYSGIIFSSPRCVQAVALALNCTPLPDIWQTKHNYVVGETTYRAAVEQLQLHCKGKESGNAVNLAKLIISNYSKEPLQVLKPFLFPHGNLKTGVLNAELVKEGFGGLDEVLVYETMPSSQIESDMQEVTENFQSLPEFIVFFSPSGLRSSLPYLRKVHVDLNQIKLVAIGPVTEMAIKEEHLSVYSVARNPTPEDILECIMKSSSPLAGSIT